MELDAKSIQLNLYNFIQKQLEDDFVELSRLELVM